MGITVLHSYGFIIQKRYDCEKYQRHLQLTRMKYSDEILFAKSKTEPSSCFESQCIGDGKTLTKSGTRTWQLQLNPGVFATAAATVTLCLCGFMMDLLAAERVGKVSPRIRQNHRMTSENKENPHSKGAQAVPKAPIATDVLPSVPQILFNSDGGAPAFCRFNPSTIAEGLHSLIDDLADTQVDVFIQCINYTHDQYFYPTKVAEYYGQYLDEHQFTPREIPESKRAAENIRALVAAGKDPLKVWADRAHQHGMQFWANMRMNDVHKDHSDIWPSFRSRWEQDHNVRIGADLPDHYKDARLNYTWAMDYAIQEVRDRHLAVIEEVCRDYDVDGFEMDFQRHPYFFRHGQRERVTPLMTQFVCRVRQRVNEIGDEKGRNLVLAVKVPQTLAYATMVGLDVGAWIRGGLVDVVTPMHTGYLDMNAHVADYVELARGTECKVYGGLEMNVTDYVNKATIEMQRAAASGYYEEGAAGMYLFNYDAHSPRFPFPPEYKQVLREIGDRRMLAGKNKHYYLTRDMRGHTSEETAPPLHKVGGEMQLPATLYEGELKQFRFTVGDDLDRARQDGALDALQLKIGFKGYQPSHEVAVQLNGQPASEPEIDGDTFVFRDLPVRQGCNQLVVSQRNANGEGIRIERVELIVRYKSGDD